MYSVINREAVRTLRNGADPLSPTGPSLFIKIFLILNSGTILEDDMILEHDGTIPGRDGMALLRSRVFHHAQGTYHLTHGVNLGA